jgi:hypothetical protein
MKDVLSELKQQQEEALVKMEQAGHQVQRLENRQAYLESGERRARAHHMITRGAAVESLLPQVKPLTEAEFYSFVESILSIPSVRSAVGAALSPYVHSEETEHPKGGD